MSSKPVLGHFMKYNGPDKLKQNSTESNQMWVILQQSCGPEVRESSLLHKPILRAIRIPSHD